MREMFGVSSFDDKVRQYKKYVGGENDTWKLKTDSTVLNHVKKSIYKRLNELIEKDNHDFLLLPLCVKPRPWFRRQRLDRGQPIAFWGEGEGDDSLLPPPHIHNKEEEQI